MIGQTNFTKNEFVELYNQSDQEIILNNFKLTKKTASGAESNLVSSGKFIGTIAPHGYFVIAYPDYKEVIGADLAYSGISYSIADNNTVLLYDKSGILLDEVSFGLVGMAKNPLDNQSIGRWNGIDTDNNSQDFTAQKPTPGQANEKLAVVVVEKGTEIVTEIEKEVFVNVYAYFSVATKNDKVKVTWDFGDGHKSYLAETKHKYAEVGIYQASVKIIDGSEEVLKEFTVEVAEVAHPKVRIVAVNANPKGADTGIESLTIENKTNKKINLLGWSIATGWKKFINHPIREDVIIKKGKTKEVTHEVSSFTLNNTKAKIQLRYPDDKVAQQVKYKKVEGIKEEEIYQHKKGGWEWKVVISNQQSVTSNQNAIDNSQQSVNSEQGTINNSQQSVISEQEAIGNMPNTIENKWEVEPRKILLSLRETDSLLEIEILKNTEFVFEVVNLREVDGQYFFTPQIEQKHYLISFWERFFASLNAGMNQMLNYF